MEVGDVDREPRRGEVLPQRRVAERLDADADLGRRRYGGQRPAEHLDDAELAALLLGGVVLEAAEPHRRHRPRRDRHRAADRDPPATMAASPRTAAAPRARSARRGTAAGRGCCRPVRSTPRTGSPTRAAAAGGPRRTTRPGRREWRASAGSCERCTWRRWPAVELQTGRYDGQPGRPVEVGTVEVVRERCHPPTVAVARFDIGEPIAVGFLSVAREHNLSACPDSSASHRSGPDLCGMSEAGHEKRVVAGDRRLGCRRPAGRRTRSDSHRTRSGSAPAPHGRVFRPRGTPEGFRPCPSGHDRALQRTGGRVPLARTSTLIDRQKLEQQLMSTR